MTKGCRLSSKPNQSVLRRMSKIALVTGGTKGIGKAVSFRLLNDGWKVIVNYSSDSETAEIEFNEMNTLAPGRVFLLKADISDLNSIDLINDFLIKGDFFIDAIVFNAGLTDRSDFFNIKADDWNKVFNANLNFPVFLLQKIDSRINNFSSITFTGSLMAIHAHSVSLAYGVSKAAVHALVKNLVKFYIDRGIRINAVAPGFVDSDWHKNKPQEIKDSITNKIALKRFSTTDEISEIYSMLINNKYINGEIVVCDGGYCYK